MQAAAMQKAGGGHSGSGGVSNSLRKGGVGTPPQQQQQQQNQRRATVEADKQRAITTVKLRDTVEELQRKLRAETKARHAAAEESERVRGRMQQQELEFNDRIDEIFAENNTYKEGEKKAREEEGEAKAEVRQQASRSAHDRETASKRLAELEATVGSLRMRLATQETQQAQQQQQAAQQQGAAVAAAAAAATAAASTGSTAAAGGQLAHVPWAAAHPMGGTSASRLVGAVSDRSNRVLKSLHELCQTWAWRAGRGGGSGAGDAEGCACHLYVFGSFLLIGEPRPGASPGNSESTYQLIRNTQAGMLIWVSGGRRG